MLKKAGLLDWIFGPLLAVMIFVMGFVVGSSPHPSNPTEQKSPAKAYDTTDYYYPYYALRNWFGKDAAGFFTALLFFVGFGQAALFYVQLRLFRESLDDNKEAAQAATRQAKAAEDSLTKLERPYLFVFNISALEVVVSHDSDEDYTYLRVTYSVANYGKMPAVLQHAAIGLSVFSKPLDPPPLDFDHTLLTSPLLQAGETRLNLEGLLNWSGNDLVCDEDGSLFPAVGRESVWFRAAIRYRGPFTDGHETSVGLRCDPRTGRFFQSRRTEHDNYYK